MIVLEEKGLGGYPNKLIEFSKQEHKGEDVKKLNPRGQVNLIYFLRINVHTQSVFKCSKSKMEAGIFIAKLKTNFTRCSGVSIIDFEQVNNGLVNNENSQFFYIFLIP